MSSLARIFLFASNILEVTAGQFTLYTAYLQKVVYLQIELSNLQLILLSKLS